MPSSPESTKEEIRKYEKAIKRHNDTGAMVHLSGILCFGEHIRNDVPRGLQLLERAVKQEENPIAMRCLAYCISVTGDAKQRRRVIPLVERSLRIREDPWPLLFLSDVLFEGKCGESDPINAIQLHERALRLEHTPENMTRLARKMLMSTGLSGEKNRALRLYKKAIRLTNDGQIMNELGSLYHEGTPNLPRCDKCAITWFKRAAKLGNGTAACKMANMLTDRCAQFEPDPIRALQVLENAHRLQPSAKYLVKMAHIYSDFDEVLDFSLSIKLYEKAILHFDDEEARMHMFCLLHGFKGYQVSFPRVIEFAMSDYERTKNAYSLHQACCILWSGAQGVPANPQRALELMKAHGEDWYGLRALMLRYQNGKYKRDFKLAQRLSKKVSRVYGKLIQAIILSEKSGEQNKQKAEDEFRLLIADDSSKNHVSWTSLSFRQCAVDLPFHGGRECMTHAMKSFESIYDLAVLNLASLLLERSEKGKENGEEVVELLEGILESDVRVMACLNLVYVLWNGSGGVQREGKRAMELLEEAVTDTKDLSARTMLANALAERDEASDEEMERSLDLWKEVNMEMGCEDEVNFKLKRFISDRSWKVWGEFQVNHGQRVDGSKR